MRRMSQVRFVVGRLVRRRFGPRLTETLYNSRALRVLQSAGCVPEKSMKSPVHLEHEGRWVRQILDAGDYLDDVDFHRLDRCVVG